MSRKLIITPFDAGAFYGAEKIINGIILADVETQFDLTHIVLSSVMMAGVDFIYSFGEIKFSKTRLIKKIVSKKDVDKWIECRNRVENAFEELTVRQLRD